jgi:chromosome segregation ATPase
MKEQLEERLKELRTEFESGQKMLEELETKRENLRQTMLRISGAIQVIEEELARFESLNGSPPEQNPDGS